MPIFFLFVGILLIVAGINNKIGELGELIKEDFQPNGNAPSFTIWIIAIVIAGAFGFVKTLKPISNAFLVLILVAMILSNRGFFTKFMEALKGNRNG